MTCKKLLFLLSLLAFVLFFSPPQPEAICVSAKKANLRQGPGLKYKVKWEVFKYMPLQKIGRKGEWLRVKDVDGEIYWAHKKLFTKSFKCAVIKKNDTNIRKSPGTNAPKVYWAPVQKYFSLKVVKIKGNWVKVMDAVGDKGWVYRPLVWIQ